MGRRVEPGRGGTEDESVRGRTGLNRMTVQEQLQGRCLGAGDCLKPEGGRGKRSGVARLGLEEAQVESV